MAAGKRRLQQAAINFRVNYPDEHYRACCLIKCMANYIRKTGASEVAVGIRNGEVYESAN